MLISNQLFMINQSKFLKAYIQHFNREKVEIHNCSNSVTVEVLCMSLNRENSFYNSLTMTEPKTMIKAMYQVAKYIKLEED